MSMMLFRKPDGENGSLEDQLFDMLKGGNPEPMAEDDAYEQAMAYLMENKREPKKEDDDFAFGANEEWKSLLWDEDHPRDGEGKFTKEHVSTARRGMASGTIAPKRSDTPITSDASGRQIRHYVELPNGAKVHPDELHRAKFDGDGRPFVSSDEGLTTIGAGSGKSRNFAHALAVAAMSNGQTSIQSPHGYSVTLSGDEWRKISQSHNGEGFSEWFDETGHALRSDGGSKARQLDDAGDFFGQRVAGQGSFMFKSPSRRDHREDRYKSIPTPFLVRKSIPGEYDESKHNRDHGKFASSPGSSGGTDSSQPKAPAVSHEKLTAFAEKWKAKHGENAHAALDAKMKELASSQDPASQRQLAGAKLLKEHLGQAKASDPVSTGFDKLQSIIKRAGSTDRANRPQKPDFDELRAHLEAMKPADVKAIANKIGDPRIANKKQTIDNLIRRVESALETRLNTGF